MQKSDINWGSNSRSGKKKKGRGSKSAERILLYYIGVKWNWMERDLFLMCNIGLKYLLMQTVSNRWKG